MARRIVCIGGGPGGLYTALLLKRGRPDDDVHVYERDGEGDTFGFGVVFSEPTLRALRERDPWLTSRLVERGTRWEPIELRVADETIRCHGNGFAAIGRRELLRELAEEGRRLGVQLHFGAGLNADELPSADVIVAADGVASRVRKRFEAQFEPTVEVGSTKFAWFGTTQRFDALTFVFERNEHGAFAVHAYPYAPDRSTFIVETDEETWRAAGLDGADEAKSLAYCERVFARTLGKHRLVANRTAWARFKTLRNESWHHENVVLVGDAAHTAHFSVGSGTKMALEDAQALSAALLTEDTLDAAFARYETERKPAVRKLQISSVPSLFWWERFGKSLSLPLEAFAFRFLTRNHKVTRESLVKQDPAFVRRVESSFGLSDQTQSVRELPFAIRDVRLPGRLVSDGDVGREHAALLLDRPPTRDAGWKGMRGALLHCSDALPEQPNTGWVEIECRRPEHGSACIESARLRWQGPLSARMTVTDQNVPELVRVAAQHARAGADVITIDAAPRRLSRAIMAAEVLRSEVETRVMIACPMALADTLLLSMRADLCLVRPSPDDAA